MTSVVKPPTSNRIRRSVSPRRTTTTRMMSVRRGDSRPPSPSKSVSSNQSSVLTTNSGGSRIALTIGSTSTNHQSSPGGDSPSRMNRVKPGRRASTGMDGSMSSAIAMLKVGDESISANSGHRQALYCNSNHSGTGGESSRMTRAKTNRRASVNGPAMAAMRIGGVAAVADDVKKATSNNRPVISPFLRSTHKNLKDQIGKIQEQIRFIQNFALMKDNKKIETLFEMIDGDSGGSVDAGELAKAMRRNDELSFSDSIEKAIDMVAKFDANGDGELDKTEFQAYVKGMVKELDLSCSEFCELIIVQLLLSGDDDVAKDDGAAVDKENISEEVKKRKSLYVFISENKEDLEELFDLFKAKKSAEQIKFADVARAFVNCDIIKNSSKRFGIADSLEVLLMTSSDDKRLLDFKQFGRLVLSVVKTSRKSFDDVADSLFNSVKGESTWDNDANDQSTAGSTITGIDELTSNRLKKLFCLWDADGDGDISKEELSNGLKFFQSATGMKGDTDSIAKALISFDTDGDNQLDPREFCEAMFQYAKISGVEINVLIDFMCIASSIEQKTQNTTYFPEFNEEDFEETVFEFWG